MAYNFNDSCKTVEDIYTNPFEFINDNFYLKVEPSKPAAEAFEEVITETFINLDNDNPIIKDIKNDTKTYIQRDIGQTQIKDLDTSVLSTKTFTEAMTDWTKVAQKFVAGSKGGVRVNLEFQTKDGSTLVSTFGKSTQRSNKFITEKVYSSEDDCSNATNDVEFVPNAEYKFGYLAKASSQSSDFTIRANPKDAPEEMDARALPVTWAIDCNVYLGFYTFLKFKLRILNSIYLIRIPLFEHFDARNMLYNDQVPGGFNSSELFGSRALALAGSFDLNTCLKYKSDLGKFKAVKKLIKNGNINYIQYINKKGEKETIPGFDGKIIAPAEGVLNTLNQEDRIAWRNFLRDDRNIDMNRSKIDAASFLDPETNEPNISILEDSDANISFRLNNYSEQLSNNLFNALVDRYNTIMEKFDSAVEESKVRKDNTDTERFLKFIRFYDFAFFKSDGTTSKRIPNINEELGLDNNKDQQFDVMCKAKLCLDSIQFVQYNNDPNRKELNPRYFIHCPSLRSGLWDTYEVDTIDYTWVTSQCRDYVKKSGIDQADDIFWERQLVDLFDNKKNTLLSNTTINQ